MGNDDHSTRIFLENSMKLVDYFMLTMKQMINTTEMLNCILCLKYNLYTISPEWTRTEWLSVVNDFITKASMKILIIQTPIYQLL